MASSEVQIVSDSTTETETPVAEDLENTDTPTIDNVFYASGYGDFEKLRKFVEQDGASISLPDNDGYYALQWAALNNYPQIVQYIIEHGGEVNAVDNSQQTALHWAAVRGCISAADVLLQNGALLEAADMNGYRAVHVTAQYGQTSFLNHIVAKHNADFDVLDNDGRSPLHWAAYKGFVDTVTWLLSRDASQKRQDIEGYTPLHWAARKEKIEVCTVLIDAGTKEEIWLKENEGNTPIQLASANCHSHGALLLSKALQAECKHLQNSNLKGKALEKGENCPMIIAMQGDAYTGKSFLAKMIALRFKCTIICLDDVLDGSQRSNEQDTLISHAFNIIAQIVKTHISLGLSVIVDSPLSRLSHLQKLVSLLSTENILHHTRNTRLLIMECKPENLYAYQLRFEATGSVIYPKNWYKPAAEWPLPKLTRDYTDADIPPGVSKLVVDTSDYYSMCQMYKAMVDVTSCGCGHISKYGDYWHFIHEDKSELFNCPHCNTTKSLGTSDDKMHNWTFHQSIDHSDEVCGVCDNQVLSSCYTCCSLTLHEQCAELARGDKKHFVPESFPQFIPSEPHLMYAFPMEQTCAECRKHGNSFSSKCTQCLFESHLKSRLVPTVVRHRAHNHVLTLWLNSNVGGPTRKYMCLACRKYGQFAAYVLDLHCMYHPQCALSPPSIQHTHGGYTHDMEMIIHREEEMEDYICDCCLYKMNPTAWYYQCNTCNLQVHLHCAFQDFDSGGSVSEPCPHSCIHPCTLVH